MTLLCRVAMMNAFDMLGSLETSVITSFIGDKQVTLNVAVLCWRNQWKLLERCPRVPGCGAHSQAEQRSAPSDP